MSLAAPPALEALAADPAAVILRNVTIVNIERNRLEPRRGYF
jgi:hypothetical protein